MTSARRASGNTVLMIVVAATIILIGVGFIFFQLTLGGSKEVQNAIDAGSLQAVRTALTVPRIELTRNNSITGLDEITQFGAVARRMSNGKGTPGNEPLYVDLQNINRVWGIALVEALNVQKMQKLGLDTPQSIDHAVKLQQTAADISRRLTTCLLKDTDSTGGTVNPLRSEFLKMANANTIRMFDSGQSMRASSYAAAYTDREQDSNVEFQFDQTSTGLLALDNVLGSKVLNGTFVKGYVPIVIKLKNAPPLRFMFVPLHHDKKPHLISRAQFERDANTNFIPAELRGVIPPNAFCFGSRVYMANAKKDIELSSCAVCKDLTIGSAMENKRGFIRIENLPGIGTERLHAIDEANREIVSGYNSNLSLLPGEAGLVLGRSLFNPVQNKYGVSNYAQDCTAEILEWCTNRTFVGFLFFKTICTDFPCCLAKVAPLISEPLDTPIYAGRMGYIINRPSMKPTYGFTPALSSPGTGLIHNPASGGSINTVTPANVKQHTTFFQWLQNFYDPDVYAIYLWWLYRQWEIVKNIWTLRESQSNLLIAQYSSSHPELRTPQPALALGQALQGIESGMKDRFPSDSRLVSLLNGQKEANFTRDGSLATLLHQRRNDRKVKAVYDIIIQRIRQMSPQATLAEIEAVLASPKKLPMGKTAFIVVNDAGKLQLAVLPSDPLPTYLSGVQNERPDGTEIVMEFRDDDLLRSYRLVDPNADFQGEIRPDVAAKYPSRACSVDRYRFAPSSGINGLFGVLKLSSKLERKCFKHGALSTEAPEWSQPDDCFCSPAPNDTRQGINCDPSTVL